MIQEAEQRQGEEQARVEAERQRWREQLDEARQQTEHALASAQDERERYNREANAWSQERAQLSIGPDLIQNAVQEADQRHQADIARFHQALAEAQRRAEVLEQRNQELGGQVQRLLADAQAQRPHPDRERERQESERVQPARQPEPAPQQADPWNFSVAAGISPVGRSAAPETVPNAEPAPADRQTLDYRDIALDDYNSEVFKREMRKRQR